MERPHHEDLVTDAERNIVRAMLRAAKFRTECIEWMAQSCPSVAAARAICNERRRTSPDVLQQREDALLAIPITREVSP